MPMMKTNVSDLHFRVIDHGLFVPIARRLAREAGKVTYYTPTEKAFPTVQDAIGDGFKDIERVNSELEDKESVDVWVFPDVSTGSHSQLQLELLSQGKLVWGARDADIIEVSRGKFLSELMTTDLPVPKYQKIIGMTALREYLHDREDQWIKVTKFRGDWETMHFRNWRQDEMELDARAVKLGPWKDVLPFYVFEPIVTEIEDGCDTWCIDSQFPSRILHGMEHKDKAFICSFQALSDLPKEVRCVNDAFGPILARYGYRSFFSCEVRITKEGESNFIDPTLRAGSPPSQVMTEMIGNYAEVIWKGAQGECIDAEEVYQFGVQAIVCVKGGRNNWRTVEIPKQIEDWFKAGMCSFIDGRYCFPPDPDEPGGHIGWLLGCGDTAQAAIGHLKDNASQLPDGLTCEFTALADLLKEVEKAEQEGMKFSDQEMPNPETVLADDS